MTLIEAVKGTYEVIGQSMTDTELAMVASDLSVYPSVSVLTALTRCRRELKRITLSDIIDRIPGGHPGVEEAWAIAVTVMGNENATVVWTNEIREAYGVAAALADDLVAARMAFKETYLARVGEARASGKLVAWYVSLGWDKQQREVAIREAFERGRLTYDAAKRHCQELALPNSSEAMKLLEEVTRGLPAMPSAN